MVKEDGAGADNLRFPAQRILDLIGDKWTPVVLYCISLRELQRFNELQRQIPDISKKMLIQTLRNLERDGLVERTVYQQVPPKTEYRLKTAGGSGNRSRSVRLGNGKPSLRNKPFCSP